jgi:hypothetical protein
VQATTGENPQIQTAAKDRPNSGPLTSFGPFAKSAMEL